MTLKELRVLTEAMSVCNRLADRGEVDRGKASAIVLELANLLGAKYYEPTPIEMPVAIGGAR